MLVEDGRILSVEPYGHAPRNLEAHDAGDLFLMPGLVDSHVHINEPGRTEWEGFKTATRAAAAGGITSLVDMPLNCLPGTTNVEALKEKRAAAQGQCRVDWSPWGGVIAGNYKDIPEMVHAGVGGFKCFLVPPGVEGFTMVEERDLRLALPMIVQSGLPLLVHAELPGPIEAATLQVANGDWKKYSTYLASRPDEAETSAIRMMIDLCREYSARIHIVHLSSAMALNDLENARAEGLPITVETCPHYLHFSAEDICDGATHFKCAPPIRKKANQQRLWQALVSGTIDLVASDHSPCPPEMKRMAEGSFQTAWGGIASLSVTLPVMWTEVRNRGLCIHDLVRWMAEKPAGLAGLEQHKGKIASGYDADFVFFDGDASFSVTPDRLHHRHRFSPYVGEDLAGVVRQTFVRGHEVFREGHFPGEPVGREIPR